MTSVPDVLQCSAPELATYLLEHRFGDDAMATTTFLLEGVSALPGADAIAAELVGAEEEDDSNAKKDIPLVSSTEEVATLGGSLLENPIELSFLNPRGKFNVMFHEEGVHATTVKNPQSLVIPAEAVRNVIFFPKPQDCQRVLGPKAAAATTTMVLICFHDQDDNDDSDVATVTFKDKALAQLCFSLPNTTEGIAGALAKMDNDADTSDEETSNDNQNANKNDAAAAWIRLLCHSLQVPPQCIFRIHNPATSASSTRGWNFKSHQEANTSTTTGGMPFVKCYQGVQDGVLFPMREGLLFFKPPMFVPRGQLHSIACGRGAGTSSRYVDMTLMTNNEESIEFSNIDRAEIGVLNDYIHKVLIPAMKNDSQQPKDKETDDDDSDDEAVHAVAVAEDDDEDNAAEVEVKGEKKQRQAKLAAKQTQQQHADDSDSESEGDDDFSEPGDDSSDEEDDNNDAEQAPADADNGGDDYEEEEDDDGGDDEEEEEGDQEATDTEHGGDDNDEETEDEDESPKAKKQRMS